MTGDKYCRRCGQQVHLHPITLGHVFHDGIHFFLHADKSVFTLIKRLASRSGAVAREFVEGKRKKYFPPLNFFLLVAGLVVLSMSAFRLYEKESAATTQQIQAIAASEPNPVKKQFIIGVMQRQSKAMLFTRNYSNMISMVAVPLLTFFMWLFYARGRYRYAEHLVANLYATGFSSLIMALVIIPLMALASGTKWYFAVLLGYMVFEIVYRSIFYYHFVNRKGGIHAVKAVAAALVSQVLWVTISFALIFYYIRSGLWGLFA